MMIRRLTTEDVAQVAAIEEQCFSQPWSQQAFADAAEDANAVFFVATEEENILGYAGMYVSFEEGEITNVAVDPCYRRGGVGAAILAAMQEYGREHGVSRIVLEVRAGNTPAIGLYEKMGFVSLGVRKGFYDFPKEDAIIMEYAKQ